MCRRFSGHKGTQRKTHMSSKNNFVVLGNCRASKDITRMKRFVDFFSFPFVARFFFTCWFLCFAPLYAFVSLTVHRERKMTDPMLMKAAISTQRSHMFLGTVRISSGTNVQFIFRTTESREGCAGLTIWFIWWNCKQRDIHSKLRTWLKNTLAFSRLWRTVVDHLQYPNKNWVKKLFGLNC